MPRLRHSYGLNHLHYVTTSIPQAGLRHPPGFRMALEKGGFVGRIAFGD
jgi:hypothetical protein